RYPDPRQEAFKARFATLRGLSSPDHLFVGVGSDEALDLAVRVFCVPGRDAVLTCPPTYGMYSVVAQTNDVRVVRAPLRLDGLDDFDGSGAFVAASEDDAAAAVARPPPRFSLDVPAIAAALRADPLIKIVFLCSPGNPTGTRLDPADIRAVLELPFYHGMVLVDEAYVDFCPDPAHDSVAAWTARYPNLIVTQTLSKAFGLAGVRLGIAIASTDVAAIFNKTKAPYNVSTPASTLAVRAMEPTSLALLRDRIALIAEERKRLVAALRQMPRVGAILGGNHANFVLARVIDDAGRPDNARAVAVYRALAEEDHVVVRFRGNEPGCEGCLRITVGTPEENTVLLACLAERLSASNL
ncbi:histidinol-phosphate transaminase, partial [Cladochytrium tenue]